MLTNYIIGCKTKPKLFGDLHPFIGSTLPYRVIIGRNFDKRTLQEKITYVLWIIQLSRKIIGGFFKTIKMLLTVFDQYFK